MIRHTLLCGCVMRIIFTASDDTRPACQQCACVLYVLQYGSDHMVHSFEWLRFSSTIFDVKEDKPVRCRIINRSVAKLHPIAQVCVWKVKG